MSEELTYRVHFRNGTKGKKRLKAGAKPPEPKGEPVPRIARLMALAIHFDQLIRDGAVEDYADLARLGKVSRARITQIMDLLRHRCASDSAPSSGFGSKPAGGLLVRNRMAEGTEAGLDHFMDVAFIGCLDGIVGFLDCGLGGLG